MTATYTNIAARDPSVQADVIAPETKIEAILSKGASTLTGNDWAVIATFAIQGALSTANSPLTDGQISTFLGSADPHTY